MCCPLRMFVKGKKEVDALNKDIRLFRQLICQPNNLRSYFFTLAFNHMHINSSQ